MQIPPSNAKKLTPQTIVLHALAYSAAALLVSCGLSLQTAPNAKNKSVRLTGKELQGAEISAVNEQGKPLTFQIKKVELDPQDTEKETYLYTVFYKTNSHWQNLCQPDVKHVAKAIPLAGSWDATGQYHASSDTITFACTNGALAKCVRFGYKPWKTVQGHSLRDLHQACTRMVRADYCGNGRSYTRERTPIDIYDTTGIQKPVSNDGMLFEAAWAPDGATFVNRARWFESPAQILQACSAKLAGRVNLNRHLITAEQAQHQFPTALLFNNSYNRKKS